MIPRNAEPDPLPRWLRITDFLMGIFPEKSGIKKRYYKATCPTRDATLPGIHPVQGY